MLFLQGCKIIAAALLQLLIIKKCEWQLLPAPSPRNRFPPPHPETDLGPEILV